MKTGKKKTIIVTPSNNDSVILLGTIYIFMT